MTDTRLFGFAESIPGQLAMETDAELKPGQPVIVTWTQREGTEAYFVKHEAGCGSFVNWRDSGMNDLVPSDTIRPAVVDESTADWS